MESQSVDSKIVRAQEIKPNFMELKTTWGNMLSKYFTPEGEILPEYRKFVNCDFCDSDNSEEQFKLNGFSHHRCNTCDTLYVSPRLSDEVLTELYSNDFYSEKYSNSMLTVFELRKSMIGKSKAAQILNYSDAKPTETRKYLDIGAGIGEVPEVMKELGWKTTVTEMNSVAIDWLSTRNHDRVFHGTLDQFESTEKYDVATAWGVIEHVIDADAFLKKAHSLLKDGGLFVSEIPHGNCVLINYTKNNGLDPERILMGEQHIVLYSQKAYEELHRRNGFELVHIQTNGLDFSTIAKLENLDLPPSFILKMQKSIDDSFAGDLLRGFWKKI